MYRLVKLSRIWYAKEIDEAEDDIEDIQEFVDTGSVVLLAPNLEYAAEELGIEQSEINVAD